MDIIHYFEPYKGVVQSLPGVTAEEALGSQVLFYKGQSDWFVNFSGKVVIIGVPEARNSTDNRGCAHAPDAIRAYLYAFSGFSEQAAIGDAGNIRGNSLNDRYQALQETITFFNQRGVVVLVLGGSQDLTVSVVKGLLKLNPEIPVNIAIGDARLDIDPNGEDFSSQSWLSYLIKGFNRSIGDLVVFGTQKYLVSNNQDAFLSERFFEMIRLGELRGENISQVEIPIRDARIVSMDFRMIKGQPQLAAPISSPHGLEPYDACRIMRYSGMSNLVEVAGIFDTPVESGHEVNSVLAAEMAWHFIDGFYGRYMDQPDEEAGLYKKYVVPVEGMDEPLLFFRNTGNERWWFKAPLGASTEVAACSRDDYRQSLRNEVPAKWWRLFMRGTCRAKSND